MRRIWYSAMFFISMSVYAAPPPNSDGRFRDWFRSLRMPGSPDTMCCTVADCRMVEARWNDQTQHFEARVTRDKIRQRAAESDFVSGGQRGIPGGKRCLDTAVDRQIW